MNSPRTVILLNRSYKSCVVGMSGGVDSTAAACEMIARGYSVTGVTIRFFTHLEEEARKRDDNVTEKAAAVCAKLGIPHLIIDAGKEFKGKVIKYFVDSYGAGKTPNPCIICNELIKFPFLEKAADSVGARNIVTGHYAIMKKLRGRPYLASAADRSKDQSYFLYRVPVKHLLRTVFPMGGRRKGEVRDMVKDAGLKESTVMESQDVCFIPDGDLKSYLSRRLDSRRGDVLDTSGNKLGEHDGVYFYTVGQRKGLGISSSSPLYVSEIDEGGGRIVLGKNEDLYSEAAICSSLRLRTRKIQMPLRAKIRFRQDPVAVFGVEIQDGLMKVLFSSPQRAVTPGQSLVLYDEGIVVGGGIIEKGE